MQGLQTGPNRHLDFLHQDVQEDEMTVHAIGKHIYILTAVVSEDCLNPLNQDDLLGWSCTPPCTRAGYEWHTDRDVRLQKDTYSWGSQTLKEAHPLVFYRKARDGAYYDILQEYLHLTDIHWDADRRAYCRLDKHSDWEHVVSITPPQDKLGLMLASFQRGPLDEFLAVSKSVLVRMFEFEFRPSQFDGWPDDPPAKKVNKCPDFFYSQQIVHGQASWTRGVQIVRPRHSRDKIVASIRSKFP